MTDKIVQQSIFDGIRKFDSDGNEYWLARELMPLLGYRKWERFVDAIDRAKFSCKNTKESVENNFEDAGIYTRGVPSDYKLSRFASYLIAMNGDPRKSEIANAQTYFVVKTREAETLIPVISEELQLAQARIRELELTVKLQELMLQNKQTDNAMLTMHGAQVVLTLRGMSDQIVEVEKKTLEVLDEKTGAKFNGMSLNQLKEYINQKCGIRFKSGAEIGRYLESSGNGHLIAQIPRRVLTGYIPKEFESEAIKVLSTKHRQLLIGETEIN